MQEVDNVPYDTPNTAIDSQLLSAYTYNETSEENSTEISTNSYDSNESHYISLVPNKVAINPGMFPPLTGYGEIKESSQPNIQGYLSPDEVRGQSKFH